MKSAVFLDKDGTIIDDLPHNADPALITLPRGAGEGLRLLAACGHLLIVVSNQDGLALGRFSEAELLSAWRRTEELFILHDVRFSGFYYCPHAQQEKCACRKPAPGLIFAAAAKHGIDLGASWMIGDILNDVEAGNRAGCRALLLDSGGETEWDVSRTLRCPERIFSSLRDAGRYITAAEAARAAAGQISGN